MSAKTNSTAPESHFSPMENITAYKLRSEPPNSQQKAITLDIETDRNSKDKNE